MDLAFLLILPGLLWTQSWHLLGFYSSTRALGIVAVAVAVGLLGIVLFQDKLELVSETPTGALLSVGTTLSVFILLWAVYAVLVAGVYLWGLDSRTLGFFSLSNGLLSALFAVYFFLGGELLENGDINHVSWLLGTTSVLLALLSGLLFFYLALRPPGQGEPPASTVRTITGWFYLVFSAAIAVLGGLLLLGLNPAI